MLQRQALFWLLWLALLGLPPASSQSQASLRPPQAGDGTQRRIFAPILMYHYVSELPPNADEIRTNLTVAPALFRSHLDYLQTQGYQSISLYQLDQALMHGAPLPPKPIILTFDDGYTDAYEVVFPILQEFGMTATFFVITGFADEQRIGHLTWEQIRLMADAGMNMESHTKTHADLRERSYEFLVYELLGSLETLHYNLVQPTYMFAYPVGRYDANTLAIIQTTDILRAVTTERGSLHTTYNRYLLPRQRIANTTSVAALAALLRP